MIVPLMLSDEQLPDYRMIDPATDAMAVGLRPGTLVIFETTLPVGDTRRRFGPAIERGSGLAVGDGEAGFLLAFSPERVYSGRVFHDLATYPKLVGGVDAASTERALAFYRSVLPAPVWDLTTAEAAEFAKLAETTYRDVNIALANEFARYAERVGVDVLEVIRGANSQPFSHIHQPGIGVGGHCIPVYPHFLISRAPELQIPELARRVNDGQVGRGHRRAAARTRLAGGRAGAGHGPDLPRGGQGAGLHALHAAHRAAALPRRGRSARTTPCSRRRRSRGWASRRGPGARPRPPAPSCSRPPTRSSATWTRAWLPDLAVLYDGRNVLRGLPAPDGVTYLGVGVAPARADDAAARGTSLAGRASRR